uniref:Uncharacterized protein n=1 Tax=Anguilla anguilla TaxID=7936 RepID=A0A0E9QT30_ANGAN
MITFVLKNTSDDRHHFVGNHQNTYNYNLMS